jgi:two-component system sensor histidine kinase HydH
MDGGGRAPSIPRLEIRFTLGLVFVVLLLINAGGWIFYGRARAYMEGLSQERLLTVAGSAAARIDRDLVLSFLPGDEKSEPYRAERERLARLRDEADLDNIWVAAPRLGSLIDARPDVPVGYENPLVDLDEPALAPLWEGRAVALPIHEIEGEPFQSAFVPLIEESELRAVIGVDASAGFLDDLEPVRKGLLVTAFLSIGLASGLGLFVHRNARRLVALQGEIKDAEKLAALGTLTAGLAHEIRNPLGIIRGLAEFLSEEEKKRGDEKAFASQIVEESDRVGELLDHFLDFARPASLRIRKADLCSLVRETAGRLGQDLRERGLSLDLALPEGAIPVPMDPDRIAQVLLNLVGNAKEAGGDGRGSIGIEVETRKCMRPSATLLAERQSPKGYAEVRVTDQGAGVPDAIRDRLFDPFFTTKKRGAGLGLSIVHGIVKSHGGYVFVESGKGRGAVVGFGLPL